MCVLVLPRECSRQPMRGSQGIFADGQASAAQSESVAHTEELEDHSECLLLQSTHPRSLGVSMARQTALAEMLLVSGNGQF